VEKSLLSGFSPVASNGAFTTLDPNVGPWIPAVVAAVAGEYPTAESNTQDTTMKAIRGIRPD
jgi:hypothetical protein